MKKITVTESLKYFFTEFDEDAIINEKWEKWGLDISSKYFDLINGMNCTKSDIKEIWKINGRYTARVGTIFHKMIENFFNEKDVTFKHTINIKGDCNEMYKFLYKENVEEVDLTKEWEYFLNFYDDYNLKEWEVWCIEKKFEYNLSDNLVLVGKPDIIFKKGNDYMIVDWKRNKDSSSDFFGQTELKMCKPPYQEIPDNKYGMYQYQLLQYKNLLINNIKEYGEIKMLLVNCYCMKENYEVIEY